MTELAPSPFIENTTLQYAFDSTSLGLLMECPKKYYYTMIENWRYRESSVHLKFGGVFASALELYHKELARGSDHDQALDAAVALTEAETWNFPSENDLAQGADPAGTPWEPREDDKHKNIKNRPNLLRTVIWYLEEYRDDPAKTVILSNGVPAVELSFRFDIDAETPTGRNYMLSGHLDRVVDFCGERYVMDQKTSAQTISSYWFRQFSPDVQFTLYTLAAKVAFDTKVSGVIIDAAQIAVGFTAFSRGITMRSEAQLEEWLANTKEYFRAAERYAESGKYPMNLKSCGNYGGCPFRDVCSSEPKIRQNILETKFEKQIWNPLEPR